MAIRSRRARLRCHGHPGARPTPGRSGFFAQGDVDEARLAGFVPLLRRKSIKWVYLDAGDQSAGSIKVLWRHENKKEPTLYRTCVNRNHPPAVQFATLQHELGMCFWGIRALTRFSIFRSVDYCLIGKRNSKPNLLPSWPARGQSTMQVGNIPKGLCHHEFNR
jgi:hypothetical protein